MNIMITNVRIENFRSISNLDLTLSMTNVLIGANNSGKSNFLRAMNIALGQNKSVTSDDIYLEKNEILGKEKKAIIDLMIRPINDEHVLNSIFSDFWISVFTESWITTGTAIGDYVGIRTIIQFDALRNDYVVIHKQITDWGDSIANARVSAKKSFTGDMNNYISSFYMDAQRDIVDDIKDKKSFFGRATSKIDLPNEKIEEIESQLNSVNSMIIDNIPALRQTSSRIASIAETVGATDGIIEIEPLARKMSDLHKGMDIIFRDGNAARFPIAQHGMGTRSWISFLTLGAYIDWDLRRMAEEEPDSSAYILLTMEEPEAHLHPQAQQKLYSQICEFSGQRIISTHSPNVVAQANLDDLIHFEKKDGKTISYNFRASAYTLEEKNRIKREVIASHGDLLFSRAVVLCEGTTEEQALPVFFQKYFGTEPIFCGINIIGIGGQNYKTFLNLLRDYNISWYIFSDGEQSTIKTVKSAVNDVFGLDALTCSNVVILDNGDNYEKYLIHNGYVQEMVNAINKFEGDPNYLTDFAQTRDHTVAKREKTGLPKCPCCNQDIYRDVIRDYSGQTGWEEAVYDCCTGKQAKAKYAVVVAEEIASITDENRRYPPKVKILMNELERIIHL